VHTFERSHADRWAHPHKMFCLSDD
jgi:hypothetical protein